MSGALRLVAFFGGILAFLILPFIGVAQSRELVPMSGAYQSGTIVISTSQRKLYLANGDGTAIRYDVAVGKPGKQWYGQRYIDGKHVRPAWSPPEEVRRDNPNLPDVIQGGAANNPMGERAMTLSNSEYAIHGTNRPNSIGQFASYGCIRMHNHDIVDLFERVRVGTAVVVTK